MTTFLHYANLSLVRRPFILRVGHECCICALKILKRAPDLHLVCFCAFAYKTFFKQGDTCQVNTPRLLYSNSSGGESNNKATFNLEYSNRIIKRVDLRDSLVHIYVLQQQSTEECWGPQPLGHTKRLHSSELWYHHSPPDGRHGLVLVL